MMKMILRPVMGTVTCGLLAALAAPALADEGKKEIVVKKVHRACDKEDCDHETGHRAIFIGEDGELGELGELGEHINHWIEAGDHGVHILGGSGTFLGVQLTDLTDELRTHFGVPEGQGVMVASVVGGSPAAQAGVQVGDIITAVDGEAVKNGSSLGRLIRQRDEGETVALELYRGGRVETLSPTLAKNEAPMMKARVMRDHHGMHDGEHGMRKIMVRCENEDGAEDCEVTMGDAEAIDIGSFDCGGAEECRVQVECDEAGCECTANGDAIDCDDLPGFSELHGG